MSECKTTALRASRSIKWRLYGICNKDRTFTVNISLTEAALKGPLRFKMSVPLKVGTLVVVTEQSGRFLR